MTAALEDQSQYMKDRLPLFTAGVVGLSFILLLAGLFVISGGILLRGDLAATPLTNVGFLAAYPVLSLMMIALDVVVILALTVHGSEMRARRH